MGFTRAGFKCLAAIDFNHEAVKTFEKNLKNVEHVLEKDITKFPPVKLAKLIGTKSIDVIIGGPPCQGFSTVRQVDAANHGKRVKRDKRRYLFREFFRYVNFFRPRIFVMENVLGIQSAAKGKFLTIIQGEARKMNYRLLPIVEEASNCGIPQKRRRQLFIGVRADIPGYFLPELPMPERAKKGTTLWDAIGDLPRLHAGEGNEECDYDMDRRRKHKQRRACAQNYCARVLEVKKAKKLTAHRARPHSARDIRDFKRLREGEHSQEAINRGEKMEFPYNRECFQDRYKRQHRNKLCSTIVAHLSKDGLMFIHPTQDRTLTPREAARVQSFPDWFKFPVSRTHQFRLIGNAVPPLVGESVGIAARDFLKSTGMSRQISIFELSPLPSNDEEALEWLSPLLDKSVNALRKTPLGELKQAWYAIAYLYTGLHPDGALDHGDDVCDIPPRGNAGIESMDARLIAPYYERSGWPVVLAPIAHEVWRRFGRGKLKDDEFYCSEAQMAGVCHRSYELSEEVRISRQSQRHLAVI